ncbi:hypothetical protein ABT095_02070 [Kitasatospora sp. NPDC002227]|uniref:hypothetical protein n=1 Tax=Kitasatospora sp. NPDC002227 TaxID=3154773 RepID=UPI0033265D78
MPVVPAEPGQAVDVAADQGAEEAEAGEDGEQGQELRDRGHASSLVRGADPDEWQE